MTTIIKPRMGIRYSLLDRFKWVVRDCAIALVLRILGLEAMEIKGPIKPIPMASIREVRVKKKSTNSSLLRSRPTT
jgi:hypothetical protein